MSKVGQQAQKFPTSPVDIVGTVPPRHSVVGRLCKPIRYGMGGDIDEASLDWDIRIWRRWPDAVCRVSSAALGRAIWKIQISRMEKYH